MFKGFIALFPGICCSTLDGWVGRVAVIHGITRQGLPCGLSCRSIYV